MSAVTLPPAESADPSNDSSVDFSSTLHASLLKARIQPARLAPAAPVTLGGTPKSRSNTINSNSGAALLSSPTPAQIKPIESNANEPTSAPFRPNVPISPSQPLSTQSLRVLESPLNSENRLQSPLVAAAAAAGMEPDRLTRLIIDSLASLDEHEYGNVPATPDTFHIAPAPSPVSMLGSPSRRTRAPPPTAALHSSLSSPSLVAPPTTAQKPCFIGGGGGGYALSKQPVEKFAREQRLNSVPPAPMTSNGVAVVKKIERNTEVPPPAVFNGQSSCGLFAVPPSTASPVTSPHLIRGRHDYAAMLRAQSMHESQALSLMQLDVLPEVPSLLPSQISAKPVPNVKSTLNTLHSAVEATSFDATRTLRGSASSPALATSLTLNSSQRLPLSPTTSFPAIGHYHKRTANFELQQNAHAIRSFAHLPDGLSAKARAALAAEQRKAALIHTLIDDVDLSSEPVPDESSSLPIIPLGRTSPPPVKVCSVFHDHHHPQSSLPPAQVELATELQQRAFASAFKEKVHQPLPVSLTSPLASRAALHTTATLSSSMQVTSLASAVASTTEQVPWLLFGHTQPRATSSGTPPRVATALPLQNASNQSNQLVVNVSEHHVPLAQSAPLSNINSNTALLPVLPPATPVGRLYTGDSKAAHTPTVLSPSRSSTSVLPLPSRASRMSSTRGTANLPAFTGPTFERGETAWSRGEHGRSEDDKGRRWGLGSQI